LILDKINSPSDLKSLSLPQLKLLAEELRLEIIEITSRCGGHIAPSLGAIESTLALHYLFDSPKDKIVWDVGHQAYAHKIITGRRDEFRNLRKSCGVSGFPKRSESEHDILGVGHSSTSISVSCGLAHARDFKGEDYYVIPYIGDGALTGGVALEGLNYAGNHKFKRFIIILNDNEMSIAKNVGAFSKYLRKVCLYGQVAPYYYKLKEGVDKFLKSLPSIGEDVSRLFEHVNKNVKNFFIPGAIFQDLGFEYMGPIDGHNLDELLENLTLAKEVSSTSPVVFHIKTVKGKGYKPAEENPTLFHGLGPFKKETGEPIKSDNTPTYSKYFADVLIEEAKKDPKIVAITAAMPDGTGLSHFKKVFPDKLLDAGIAEQTAVDLGVGLAIEGKKPVVAIYSTFMQRAYDQLIHDIALQDLPVTLVMDRAGLVGEDGATHHGVFDISYMRIIPNFVVMAPSGGLELERMLKFALNLGKPVSLRIPRGKITVNSQDAPQIELGKAYKVQDGDKLAIFSLGAIQKNLLAVLKDIEKELGFSPVVWDYRFVKPLPEEPIRDAVEKGMKIITLEDSNLPGGFGSAILEKVNQLYSGKVPPILNIGISDVFIGHGKIPELEEEAGISPEKIKAKILNFWKN
jgi:1-deoxy-D-xylulose-5-phosphate synthase